MFGETDFEELMKSPKRLKALQLEDVVDVLQRYCECGIEGAKEIDTNKLVEVTTYLTSALLANSMTAVFNESTDCAADDVGGKLMSWREEWMLWEYGDVQGESD